MTSRFYRSSEHLVTAGPQQQRQPTSSIHHQHERRESSDSHARATPSTPIIIQGHQDLPASGHAFHDQTSGPRRAPLSTSAPRGNCFNPWAINFTGFGPDLNANMFPSSSLAFSSPSLAAQQCLQDLHRSMTRLGESSPFTPPASSFQSQPNINDILNDMFSAAAAAHQHQLHSNHFSFPSLGSMFPVNFPPPPDVTSLFNSRDDGVFGTSHIAMSRDSDVSTTPGVDTRNSSTPSITHRSVITIPIKHHPQCDRDGSQNVNQNYPNAFPVDIKDATQNRPQTKGDYDFLDCHHRRCQSREVYSSTHPENDNQRPENGNHAGQERSTAAQNHNLRKRVDGIPPSPLSRPKSSNSNVFIVERRLSSTPTPAACTTPPLTLPIHGNSGSNSNSNSTSSSARESRQASMSISSSSPSDSPHTPLRLRRWPSDSGLVTRQQPHHQSRYQRHHQQQQQSYHQQQQSHGQPYHRPSSSLSASASNTMSSTASSSASSTLPSSHSSSDPEARTCTPPFPSETGGSTQDGSAADFANVSYWLARMQR